MTKLPEHMTDDELLAELGFDFIHHTLEPDFPKVEGTEPTVWTKPDGTQATSGAYGDIGFLDQIFLKGDARTAAEQINDRYAHGGGYFPARHDGWLVKNGGEAIVYPVPEDEGGDEVYNAIATTTLDNGQKVTLYPSGWVLIMETNGEWNLTRMD